MLAIEFPNKVELAALGGISLSRITIEVGNRRSLRSQRCPLKYTRQKSGAPVLGIALRQPAAQGVVHYHETGKTLTFGTQTVRHPGPHTGEAHPAHAGIDHEQRGRVVVGLRVARVNERHLIDVLRDVGEDLRYPGTALTVPIELKRRLH